ncbi:lipopolysaccharide biosynthesis protein [Herbaspirillum sp. CAH-3]|uniref:lipopolysaccharide biosynthesis protein n=1 Tax=Herbaspirillum sp. CAH-3 TaxID=2605746 RepID=UPI0012ACA850|nr:lipopolysaccharide biosynthesis protein [Herbaspirillum sp. CAH-3]MRT27587.1 lipopolysaccharide biosynthesis protein [Herbaspirillum sp. CAH-3]
MSAASNVRWIAVTQVVKIGSQLVNMFVLTRLIPPSEYGLMAMAGIATNLAFILRDMGTAAAIIQKPELHENDSSSVFWLNMIGGLMLMLMLWLAAPFMASTFHEPRLTEVLWVLAITFPIAASSMVHQALLERVSRFRLIAGIESAASLLSLVIALLMAFRGAGVWSLTAQAVMTAACTTLLLWRYSPWRPKMLFDRASVRSVFSFSGAMAGNQMAAYVFRNADSFVVGKMLGATILGNYSLAYKLMLFPVQNISWVAVRSLFPVMSRRQDDQAYLASLSLRSLRLISFVAAPMMFGVASLSDLFVTVFLGPKWSLVGDILLFLGLVGYLQVITSIAAPVFMALGKTGWMLRLSLIGTPLYVIGYVLGARQGGAEGLAMAYLAVSIVMAFPTFHFACRLIGVRLKQFLSALLPSLLSGVAMMFCILACRAHIAATGTSLFVLLAGIGLLFWLMTVVLFQRTAAKEFFRLAFKRIKK